MKIRKSILPFLIGSILPTFAIATQYTWNLPGTGDWDSNSTWNPSTAFPNAVDDVAIFGNSITGPATIEFSAVSPNPITVGKIDFQTSSFMYTLETVFNPFPFQTIAFHSSTGNAQLNVASGAQDVLCDFIHLGNVMEFSLISELDCNISAGRTVIFNAPDLTGVGSSLNLIGPGTLRFQGGSGLVDPAIHVARGLLELNIQPISFASTSYTISGGTLKNLNANQLNGVNPLPDMTISGGTWDMNGFTDSVGSLTFQSGSIIGNTDVLGIDSVLTMRNVTLNGNILFSAAGDAQVIHDATNRGTSRIQGNIQVAVPILFTIDPGSQFDMIVSGAIQGNPPLSKMGLGSLVLNGANNQTASIAVLNGSLFIGTSGSVIDQTVTVSQGAVFGGTGVVGTGAAIVNNAGVLSPGLSAGVLTINGTYTQTTTGHFYEELLTLTNSDKLVVNGGAVNLAGTLDLNLLSGHSLFGKNTLTIIDNKAGSGVSGTFDTVNRFGFPADTFLEVIYQPNEVLLSLFAPDAAALSPGNITAPVLSQISQNTLNFMRHLQTIRPLSIKKRPACVATQEEMENTDSLVASSTIHVNFSSDPDREPVYRSPFSRKTHTSTYVNMSSENTWGVFADAIGSLGRVYTTKSSYPFRYYNIGGLVGFDYVGENYAVGISPGYEFLEARSLNHRNQFTIQSAEGTFFATVLPFADKNVFFDFIGGGAYQWYHFQRTTPDGTVHGKPQGGQWNVYSDIGYTWEASSLLYSSATSTPMITPWLGLGYMGARIASFQERDSLEQSFSVDKQTIESLRTSLGFAVNYAIYWDTFSFFPEARVSWQREFLNHNTNISFANLPAIASQVEVMGLGRNTFFIGALLRLLFREKIDLYGSYDYEWNERFHSHLFLAGSEYRF